MSAELEAILNTTSYTAIAAASTSAVLGGTLLAAALVPALNKFILPKPTVTRLAEHLKLDAVMSDGFTIQASDGSLTRCIELEGRDLTFLEPAVQETLYFGRKNWVDSLTETGVTVRMFIDRRAASIVQPPPAANPAIIRISKAWNANFTSIHRKRLVIAITAPAGRNAVTTLNEAVDKTLANLIEYKPRLLTQRDRENNASSDLLGFWGSIASPISRPTPAGVGTNISEAVAVDRVTFGNKDGILKFHSGPFTLYGASVGVVWIGDTIDTAFVRELNALPISFTFMVGFQPWNRAKAVQYIQWRKKQSLMGRFSEGKAEQFEDALEAVEGNAGERQAFCSAVIRLFIYAASKEELEVAFQQVHAVAATHELSIAREGTMSDPSWFSMFPAYKLWPREYRIFSHNIAVLATLENQAEGMHKSPWGPGPITYFRNASGSPYAFQFHVTDDNDAPGHTLLIAPTGSGKTVLVSFLAAMAMRHEHLRSYFFDRLQGTYVFTTALNGLYLTPDGSDEANVSLNPFQCDSTPENKTFLRNFVQTLARVDDPKSLDEIGMAVDGAFRFLDRNERSLAELCKAGFRPHGEVYKGLQKWIDPRLNGRIFNAPEDTLDLASTRLVAFDMTSLYDNPEVAAAVVTYISHRILNNMRQQYSPSLVFVDETAPLLGNPYFASSYKVWLREFRKYHGVIISAFQTPGAVEALGTELAETIRTQCMTKIFFQNPDAIEEDFRKFDLTPGELAFIKRQLPIAQRLPRSVLLKKAGGESLILDVNLSPLGPLLQIFSSGVKARRLAETIARKHKGPVFLDTYLAQAA